MTKLFVDNWPLSVILELLFFVLSSWDLLVLHEISCRREEYSVPYMDRSKLHDHNKVP